MDWEHCSTWSPPIGWRSCQFKDGDTLLQSSCLIQHAFRSGGTLFHQCGVLLCHLVKLADGGMDLLDSSLKCNTCYRVRSAEAEHTTKNISTTPA